MDRCTEIIIRFWQLPFKSGECTLFKQVLLDNVLCSTDFPNLKIDYRQVYRFQVLIHIPIKLNYWITSSESSLLGYQISYTNLQYPEKDYRQVYRLHTSTDKQSSLVYDICLAQLFTLHVLSVKYRHEQLLSHTRIVSQAADLTMSRKPWKCSVATMRKIQRQYPQYFAHKMQSTEYFDSWKKILDILNWTLTEVNKIFLEEFWL